MITKGYAQDWDFKSFKSWLIETKFISKASASDVVKGFREACALLKVQSFYDGMLDDLLSNIRDFNLIEGSSKIKRGVRLAEEFIKCK